MKRRITAVVNPPACAWASFPISAVSACLGKRYWESTASRSDTVVYCYQSYRELLLILAKSRHFIEVHSRLHHFRHAKESCAAAPASLSKRLIAATIEAFCTALTKPRSYNSTVLLSADSALLDGIPAFCSVCAISAALYHLLTRPEECSGLLTWYRRTSAATDLLLRLNTWPRKN